MKPPVKAVSGIRAAANLGTGVVLPSSLPVEGLEPPRPFGHKILSLARLPIPPHRRNPTCGTPNVPQEPPGRQTIFLRLAKLLGAVSGPD